MNIPGLARQAVELYIAHPLPFLAIALIGVPVNLALWLPGVDAWWSPAWLASILVGEFVFGALTLAAATAARGETPSFLGSYRAVVTRYRPVIGVTVRYFGITVLLAITVVGIPFAIARLVRWFFSLQAVVLRDLPPSEALELSSRVVAGRWWRTLGVISIFPLFSSALWWGPLLLSWPFEVRLATFTVVGAVVFPFVAVFYTLLFLELCEREEAVPTLA